MGYAPGTDTNRSTNHARCQSCSRELRYLRTVRVTAAVEPLEQSPGTWQATYRVFVALRL